MIYCTKDCTHQQEGYCTLETLPATSSVSADSDCLYYRRQTETQTSKKAARPAAPRQDR